MEKYIDTERIKRHKIITHYPRDYHNGWNDAIDEILGDEPADVQNVKHGKDIYYTVCDKHCEFKCSVCNAWIGVVEGGTLDAARDFNYCPACGAKMDGKDNEK